MFRRLLPLVILCSGFDRLAAPGSAAAPPRVLPGAIDRLIQQLGSDDFSDRQQASKALEAMGESAVPALSEAAEQQGPGGPRPGRAACWNDIASSAR